MEESKEMPVRRASSTMLRYFSSLFGVKSRRINTGITKMSNIKYRSIFMIIVCKSFFAQKTRPKMYTKNVSFLLHPGKKFFLHYLKDMLLKIVLLL